jgi:hypothetical protein
MTTRSRQSILLLGLVTLACIAACRQVLDLHNRTEGESAVDGGDAAAAVAVGAPKCGMLRFPSPGCATCMDGSCCELANACALDSNCAPAADCFFGCGDNDSSCRGKCSYIYRWSPTFTDLVACRAAKCGATEACGLTCGGVSYTATGCEACIHDNCCTIAQACASSAPCLNLDSCNANNCMSGMQQCTDDCANTYPDGGAPFGDWNTCVKYTCAEKCRGGDSWECLDKRVYWPVPAAPNADIEFSFGVVDLYTEQPFVGTTVRSCKAGDYTCASPVETTTTDDRGTVKLKVRAGDMGFAGFLELGTGDCDGGPCGGTLSGNGSAIYPSLWYIVPPYVVGGWKGNLQFLPADMFPGIAAYMQVDLDPTKGHLAVDVLDCNFKPAPGVQLSIPNDGGGGATAFYFQGAMPDKFGRETDAQTAIAGFVNLEPGPINLKATLKADGRELGTMQVQIRAGTMTATTFPPLAR